MSLSSKETTTSASTKMSKKGEETSNANNTCVVCYKNVEYYSIGMCEHPVCYECSTRMRVLCQQNECPICRQELPKVVFTKEIKPFRFLKKGDLLDTKYNIYFDTPEVQMKFMKLLACTCNICNDNQVFSSFNGLKEHMKRKHDLHYCDLCVENLKIFSQERRCYTKTELARHSRKGDVNDKSHKGHPLCQFCNQRYMDNDELYRHLRREHLFCHFCDADGLHQYYQSYEFLREHFRKDHYLCEEGDCAQEHLTSVFRSEIDLKVHKGIEHSKTLGKAAAKQARTLELEFTLTPRDMRHRRNPPGQSSSRNHQHQRPESPPQPEEPVFVRQPLVDVQSTQEFPSLGNAAPCIMPAAVGKMKRGNLTIRGTLRQGNYDENFPALGPESSTPTTSSSSSNGPSLSKTLNFSVSSSNKTNSINGRQQSSAPNLSIHVNHRPNGTVTTRLSGPNLRINPGSSTDFPALGRQGSSEPATTTSQNQSSSSWTKITCVKPAATPRSKKVAPPPLPPSPPLINSGQDFPSLSKPSKAKKTNESTSSSSWVQVQPSKSNNSSAPTTDATKGKAKKKKMKQQQQQQATSISVSSSNNGNSSSNESSSSTKPETKKLGTKKEKNKVKQQIQSNGSDYTDITESAATPKLTERKRSEFRIDNLNTNNNNNIDNHSFESPKASKQELTNNFEDFPALGHSGFKPPGLSSPPPGFTAPTVVAPPPGFLNRLNGLTFHNSSGESYTIIPDEVDKPTYLPAADFNKRNQNLIAEFSKCFGKEDSDQFTAFHYLSYLFRTGVCDAEEYYKNCQKVMGEEAFKRIFPELLVLLPDIEKQQELFKVHKANVGNSGRIKGLESCANCGQVLRSSDLSSHANNHTLENHFPALSKATSVTTNSAWAKK